MIERTADLSLLEAIQPRLRQNQFLRLWEILVCLFRNSLPPPLLHVYPHDATTMDRSYGRDSRDDRRRGDPPRGSNRRYGIATPLLIVQLQTCKLTPSSQGRDSSRSRSPPRHNHPSDRSDRRRSRSPYRGSRQSPPPRRQNQFHDRERRDPDRYRNRSRSRSPPRRNGTDSRRERTPPRQPLNSKSGNAVTKGAAPTAVHPAKGPDASRGKVPINEVEMQDALEEGGEEEVELLRTMGFRKFRSTKNTKVPGNERNYGVFKTNELEYRQYMNRVGGFNRPLSPSRV